MQEESTALVSQLASTYVTVLQVLPQKHDQRDVEMEDGKVGKFPPLPMAGQPYTPAQGVPAIPCGSNWTTAIRGRPGVGLRGGRSVQHMPHEPVFMITSMEELEHHLKWAEKPGDEKAM